MTPPEQTELYLRLEAEKVLATALTDGGSRWENPAPRLVAELEAVVRGLSAVGVVDDTLAASLLSDVELGLWLRHLMPGDVSRLQNTVLRVLSSAPATWPPEMLDCRADLEAADVAVQILWLRRDPAETRAFVRVLGDNSAGETPPASGAQSSDAGFDLASLEVRDQSAVRYKLSWAQRIRGGTQSAGYALIDPHPRAGLRWLEFRADPAAEAVRAECIAPSAAGSGRGAAPTSTPAELYLRALARRAGSGGPSDSDAGRPPGGLDAVRRSFVELGLVPTDGAPPSVGAAATPPEADGPSPADQAGELGVVTISRAVGAELPLERLTVYVAGLAVTDGFLTLLLELPGEVKRLVPRLDGPPWYTAVDDLGRPYEVASRPTPGGIPGADVELILTPRLDPRTRSVRLTAETPFESAWVDLAVRLP